MSGRDKQALVLSGESVILNGMTLSVLLLAGGQSGEHEVSLSSARSVLRALTEVSNQNRFAVTLRVIAKDGRWLSEPESQAALAAGVAITGSIAPIEAAQVVTQYDVVFPLLHGPMGEDGTIQGLLSLAGVPFVGCGVAASAVSMDKVLTKHVLASVGLPQVQYRLALRSVWHQHPDTVREHAAALGYPLFAKPVNMGSSVGISKVHGPEELDAALELAFSYDRRVILEQMTAEKPYEVEVAILGNDHPQASVVGELSFEAEFYDYETKYTQGLSSMHIPARIPAAIAEQIRSYAVQAYQAVDGAGLARIDFFYLPTTGTLYINELNTMPGFTATSMYPKLWEASGIDYPELVAKLIELALEQR